jgi:hypothetical protein
MERLNFLTITLTNPPRRYRTPVFAWLSFLSVTGGEVGRAGGGLSPAALEALTRHSPEFVKATGSQPHSYTNTERREEGDTVFVTAQYNARVAPPPPTPMLLSEYTIDQLVDELVNRLEFAGVVIFANAGLRGQNPQAGDKFKLASNRRLSNQELQLLLRSVLNTLGG